MSYIIDRDASEAIVRVRIKDDAGSPIEGLTYQSAGLVIDYMTPSNADWVNIPLLVTTVGLWKSGGFVESPGADGWYHLGLPNAAIMPGRNTQIRVLTAGGGYRYGFVSATGNSAGAGEYSTTVTVEDGEGNKIEGARVVLEQDGLATNAQKFTGVSGVVELFADADVYNVRVNAPSGFEDSLTNPVTIGSDLTSVLVVLTESPLDPPFASLCDVTVNVLDQLGRPVEKALVSAETAESVDFAADALIVNLSASAVTNSQGQATLRLIRGSQFADGNGVYEITVNAPGDADRTFKYLVPDAAAVTVSAPM